MGAVWGQVHVRLLTRVPLTIVSDQLTAHDHPDPPVVVLRRSSPAADLREMTVMRNSFQGSKRTFRMV
jgi:hypothetical protein